MPPVADLSHITLAVLAGGQGHRMGQPKADLRIGPVPILQYLLERWRWPGPTLLVTAPGREHPAGADYFDQEQMDPPDGEAAGPLRGLLTALQHTTTPLLLATTVDMPAVPAAAMHWMVQQLLAQPSWLGLMLTRPFANTTQLEPFPFAARAEARAAVQSRLGTTRRSVIGLGETPRFGVLPVDPAFPAEMWTNLNSPDDYAAFIASVGPATV